jgi:hypothetical protein
VEDNWGIHTLLSLHPDENEYHISSLKQARVWVWGGERAPGPLLPPDRIFLSTISPKRKKVQTVAKAAMDIEKLDCSNIVDRTP